MRGYKGPVRDPPNTCVSSSAVFASRAGHVIEEPVLDGDGHDEDRPRLALPLEFDGGFEGEAGHARLQGHDHVVQQVDLSLGEYEDIVHAGRQDRPGQSSKLRHWGLPD